MWHSQKLCLRHIFIFIFLPTTNFTTALSSTFMTIYIETGCLFILAFCLPCFSLLINRMICDHICHIYWTCSWKTCSCFAIFIQHLVLEPSLWDLVFLVSCFRLSLFSRISRFLSSGLFITYMRCWHFKILPQVCIILVRNQIHVTSSHLHIYDIFLWLSWTSNLNDIVHWTIFQGLVLCPWSCICYTCSLLHLDFLVLHLKPNICLWMPFVLHVHYHLTASPYHTLCLLWLLLGNTKPWFFLINLQENFTIL